MNELKTSDLMILAMDGEIVLILNLPDQVAHFGLSSTQAVELARSLERFAAIAKEQSLEIAARN